MNAWLWAALVLMAAGLGPCVAVASAGPPERRLTGLSLAGPVTTAVLLLLAQGYRRTSYVDLALLAAVLGPAGLLVFARFLGRDTSGERRGEAP